MCDDERHIVRLIQVNLERQGYTVIPAYDGREALQILRNQVVDLLVIDSDMTAPSTDEIITQMRAIPGGENVTLHILGKRG